MADRSTTVKIAIISAISAVIVALVTGFFTVFTAPSESKETKGNCSPILTGNIHGDYKSDCK